MRKQLLLAFAVAATQALAQVAVSSGDYDLNNFRPSTNVQFSETPLPIVFITVNGQVIQRETKTLASMKIIDNGDGHNYVDTTQHAGQTIDWEGPIALKYRGNTSFSASDKKPFGIKTLSEASLDAKKAKVKIMGMGKDNDWALLAPWEDRSYMRDVLTMELARGGNSFAPHMKYCEVFVDGYYYGVYIMSERATKGKKRLNLDDPTADDLTGDFHVEIDRKDEEHYYTSKHHPVSSTGREYTNRTVAYQYKEPEYDDFAELPEGVEAAIQNAMDTMEDSFAQDDYTGSTGYRNYIDVPSFIDYQIAQEFANNVDAYRLSTPLYKYSETHAAQLGTDAKWKTALWDFNIAYGTANYYDANNTSSWRYKSNDLMASEDKQLVPFYWYKLMNDPAYVSDLRQRWTDLRGANYSADFISEKIDSLASVLRESGALDRDNQAWHNHFGTFDNYVDELNQFVKSRLAFIDKSWKLKEKADADCMAMTMASGFNADVIAEALPSASHVTGTLDNTGYALFSTGVQESGAVAGDDRKVMSNSGVEYVLADYTQPNALTLTSTTEQELAFDTLVHAKKIYVLAVSADGSSQLTVTPLYADATRGDAVTETIADWYNTTESGDEAVYGLGRILTKSSGWQGQSDVVDSKEAYNLYEMALTTDSSRKLSGIAVSKTGGRPTVLAVSASVDKEVSGVSGIQTDGNRSVVGVYGVDGKRRAVCSRGLNIVRYSDGTTRKIIVK